MRKSKVAPDLQPAWSKTEYRLIDFGEGSKLEYIGGLKVERPCPSANRYEKSQLAAWDLAHIVLGESGKVFQAELPSEQWQIRFQNLVFKLEVTPFGHVGIFPEHARNWRWLENRLSSDRRSASQQRRGLNLFGYTGAGSLVLASAGCEVVHVDSSSPAVTWAKKNAKLNGMSATPIRWIVEDARTFVRRELKRGNRYEVIVLDPPTYGHGTGGKRWSIQRDLPELLQSCAKLLTDDEATLLVSCHTKGIAPASILETLRCGQLKDQDWIWETGHLVEFDDSGRPLDFGMFVRGGLKSESQRGEDES